MSAKIVVVDGVSANSEYWIEHEVCRIGSGPACQIRIDGMPEHALTLQFRSQRYFVFNRSNSPAYLRRQVLNPGEMCEWKSDSDIQVGDYAIMKLVVHGDLRPAVVPRTRSGAPALPAGDDAAFTAKQKKQRQQLVAIALCLFGSLTLLLAGGPGPTYADHMSEVHVEIDNRLAILEANDARFAAFRQRLQLARTLELGGQEEDAQQAYSQLKDWLLHQPAAFRADPFTERLQWYVVERLRMLISSS